MELNKLKNKRILVTGATSGIGKCLTLKLINLGSKVAFCGRSKNKMDNLLNETRGFEDNCYHELFDVTNENDIKMFVKNVINNFGGIDILVNCAGANTAKSYLKDIKTSDLEYMLKLNTIAPFVFMREVYENMIKNNAGIVINVLSQFVTFLTKELEPILPQKLD